MGEVAAVAQVHAEDGVAGLHEAHVGGHIGLTARMGLDIHVITAKDFLGAVTGDVFHHVHELTATVVTLGRIAFGVLVGHDRTLGLAHGGGDKVFGSNEFKLADLTAGFLPDSIGDGGVAQDELVHGYIPLGYVVDKKEGRFPGPC